MAKLVIGFSKEKNRFLLKYKTSPMVDKAVKLTFKPSECSYNPKTGCYEIETSNITSLKLLNGITNVAKIAGFKVEHTESFKLKSEILKKHLKLGDTNLEAVSKYERKLKQVKIPDYLEQTLMPFQKEGVEFIISKNGRCLIADQQGLGKTIQALTFIKMYKHIERVLIVCPKSTKHAWKLECKKWKIHDPKFVIEGPPSKYDKKNLQEGLKKVRIVFINYDMVVRWKKELFNWKPTLIVCDEVHYIKNPEAQRTKAVEFVGAKSNYVIGMTGTPVANSPMEIFTIANMIKPNMFNKTHFNYRYCGGEGMQCRNASNAEELHNILKSSIMVRRKKEDVLTDLPPKRSIQVELEMDMTKYNNALLEWMEKVQKGEEANTITLVSKLREIIAQDKIPALLEWTDKFLEDTGRKLIIFCHHKLIYDMLAAHYKEKAVGIRGGDKDDSRANAVDRFQNDENVRVFIGSITACAEGLTLTAASDVCMAEMIFNPKKMEQAEDRSHRKGQNNHVTIWNLVCMGTYDEDLLQILEAKRLMSLQVIDGFSLEQAEASVQKELCMKLETMIAERIVEMQKKGK